MALKGSKRFKILYVANIDENREFQSLQECGLPNVTGMAGNFQYDRASGVLKSGVFSKSTTGGGNINAPQGYKQGTYTVTFDASSSSTIYKNNHNDVTPYNFNVNLLVKI